MENNTFKFKSLGIRLEKYEQFQNTGSDILGKKEAPCYTQGIPVNLNIR